jgi:hypothetical protein
MFLTPSALADLLMLAIIGVMAGHAYWLHRRGRWFVLDPLNTFWAGLLVYFVVDGAGYAELFISWHDERVFEQTLFWVLFAVVWVLIGYEAPWGRTVALSAPSLPVRLNPDRLFLAGLALLGMGVTGYLYLMSKSGGPTVWLSVGRGGTNYPAVSGYVGELVSLVIPGVTLLLFHAVLHKPSMTRRLFIYALLVLTVAWYFYLGSRSRFATLIAISVGAFCLAKRKHLPLFLMIPLAVAVLIATEFMAIYRGQFTNLSLNLDQIDTEEARVMVISRWIGSRERELSRGCIFGCTMAAVRLVPKQVSYDYGYSLLEFFTRPVPRALWPGKRYPLLEAHQSLYREGDLSTHVNPAANLLAGPALGFVANWWHIGGPIALALGGLLCGTLWRTFRMIYDRVPGSEGNMLVYAQLIMLGYMEVGGDPLYWIYSLPLVMIPLLLVIYACRFQPVRLRRAKPRILRLGRLASKGNRRADRHFRS